MNALSDSERRARAEALLGRVFNDPALLERALTHPSYSDDPDCACDYERLEFLGDAVLGLVVVDEVYRRYPDMPEGRMTKLKIALVSGTTLAEVAGDLGLAELIRMGESERGTGGRGMHSALENAFESLVGALYLDAGFEAARAWVMSVLASRIVPELADALEHPKSQLQELAQAVGPAPVYKIVSVDGPPHDRAFTAEVSIAEKVLGRGSGRSKKEAEMNAATEAVERLSGR